MCISSNSVNQAQDLISVTKFEDFPNSLLPNGQKSDEQSSSFHLISLTRVPVSAYSHKSGEYNIMFDTSLGLNLVMTAAV